MVLACALHMSDHHVSSICAGVKSWIKFAAPQGYDIGAAPRSRAGCLSSTDQLRWADCSIITVPDVQAVADYLGCAC